MMEYPRLKYCYHAEYLDDNNILLISGKENAILSGKLYRLLLPELQENSVSVDQLVTKLKGKASSFEIYYAIDALEKKGYLTEAAPSLPHEVCAYWNSLGMDVKKLLHRLGEKPVSIETIGLDRTDAGDVFRQALAAAGIQINGQGASKRPALKVIITDHYLRRELEQINMDALGADQPWMLIKPVGTELWLGPVFVPGKTGCWACLRQRLELNRPIDTLYKEHKKTAALPPVPLALTPSTVQAAAGLGTTEIVKWLYFGENESLDGKIVTVDTRWFTNRSHTLVKRPQCKFCGEPGYTVPEPGPVVLEKSSVVCTAATGGYREVPPEETVKKYIHHVSPITGVVQKLEPYHSIDGTPVYNYSAGYNIAFRSKTLFWLNNHIRSANGGKGATWEQAKAGAICEAIERYSLTYHGEEYYITGSLEELGKDAIHPNACMNFSPAQYRDREKINRECSKFYFMVPVPFDETLRMHWTPVYSLTHETVKYLPSCYCYAQYPAEDDYRLFAYPDSSGSAAGNTMEEAILQGFLELVERDSVAIWWYNMLRRPAVDLLSFNDPYFTELIAFYKSLGRSLAVLDITTDLGIPAFAAISHLTRPGEDGREDIVFGFGAHLDARIAIERALVELNQILPIVNVPEADRGRGKYRTTDKHFLSWLNSATMEEKPYLTPPDNSAVKTVSDYSRLCDPVVYDSVRYCVGRAAEHGLETLALDLTRPDIGLNVARVIVPGLRHFWRRLAPGRLYDVPVKQGLLTRALKEEELNPVALFI